MRHKIVSFVNQKGGTGKTTAAVNIGAGLLQKGFNVLLIDLDPQASATLSLGIDPTKINLSMYDVLLGKITFDRILLDSPTTGLKIAPANRLLSNTDLNLANEKDMQFRLKEGIKDLGDKYDFVLIDCPPSLSLLFINALVASDWLIIPILCDYLSLEGLKQLMDSIDSVKGKMNKEVKLLGILPNMVDFRQKLSYVSLDLVRAHFKELVFANIIRVCVRLKEAPSFGKSIFSYAPGSMGAENYQAVIEELLKRTRRM